MTNAVVYNFDNGLTSRSISADSVQKGKIKVYVSEYLGITLHKKFFDRSFVNPHF